MEEIISKKYYSISEVAAQLGVDATTIRHWELEFPHLKPKRNRKGDRQFTDKDIEALKVIYQLTREKGYTLQGAREIIKAKAHQPPATADLIESLERIKQFLLQLRDSL